MVFAVTNASCTHGKCPTGILTLVLERQRGYLGWTFYGLDALEKQEFVGFYVRRSPDLGKKRKSHMDLK